MGTASLRARGRLKDLKEQERAAVQAVARRFSATWEDGSDPPDAYVTVAGKRVAVQITTLRSASQGPAVELRLRFDKVATRVIERLRAALDETVPDGMTVLATCTAPIHLASKTAAAMEERIRALLARRPPGGDEKDTIRGNRVRIRVLRDVCERAPKLMGFVHNSDSDPLLLLDMAQESLEQVGALSGGPTARDEGDQWLVVISPHGAPYLKAHRSIYSQLRGATDFSKILMVCGDGRVEVLAE